MRVGMPHIIKDNRSKTPIEERFWKKVDIRGDNECWNWKGARNSGGYGGFGYKGKIVGSHKISYIFVYGDIPEGMEICHSCDNPACVNPKHLLISTHLDNMKDRDNKGRCGAAKITKEMANKIRELYSKGGITQEKLSVQFGITRPEINHIVRNKKWKEKLE